MVGESLEFVRLSPIWVALRCSGKPSMGRVKRAWEMKLSEGGEAKQYPIVRREQERVKNSPDSKVTSQAKPLILGNWPPYY